MPSRRLPSSSALALALSAVFGNVSAQAPPDPSEPALQSVEITGSAQRYDARRNDTASKIVVSQEEIVRQGDTTLADVLKRQPGITIGGTRTGATEIRMRGLGSGYTQVLLNGEAVPPGFSLDSLAPDLIERIEIIRSATADLSTQAIAGTINIILKKAVKLAVRELKLNFGASGALLSPSANLQIADKIDALSYSIGGTINAGTFDQRVTETDQGTDSAGAPNLARSNARRERTQFSGITLSPRLNWTLANGDTLSSQSFASLSHYARTTADRWSATLGTTPPYTFNDVQTNGDVNLLRSDLNWVHTIAGGTKLDTKIGLTAGRRASDFREQGYNSAGVMTRNGTTAADAKDRGATFTGKYSTPFADEHALALGWDAGYSWRSESRIENDRPIPGYLALNTDERYDATVRRLAAFAQDEWNVTPRWSVYLGLRWEGIDTVSAGSGYSSVNNRSSVVSPLFQTLWKLPDTKNDQVRFALSRTYKAPTTARLIPRRFTSPNNSTISPDGQGNPDLRPELAWGVDAAYEHFFAEGALFSVSTYLRRIDDFTRRAVSFNGTRWIAMPVNDGQANTRGIELETKFPLPLMFAEAPAIDVRINVARNWSTVENVPGPDNRLDDQTPFSANLGLDYKIDAQFSMGGTFSFKSGGPMRISVNQSSASITRRELDVYALWKINPRTQIRISMLNLLGQKQQYVDAYADASGSLRNTSTYPATPLLRVALEMRL